MASSIPVSSIQLEESSFSTFNSRIHRLPAGAEIAPNGEVRFRVWAPAVKTLALSIGGSDQTISFLGKPGGWHELVTAQAKAGTLYRLRLPDGTLVPDPASRFQPQDVHGPSEVIDPSAYQWKDSAWRGRPWSDAVLYDLHVGAFTEEGTFLAAIEKLDHLVQLGVTAIEIMPVADFPGKRNWGYDGVLLYAPILPMAGRRTSRP
jgi:maltooligosyltrehalose trehalohydrolase